MTRFVVFKALCPNPEIKELTEIAVNPDQVIAVVRGTADEPFTTLEVNKGGIRVPDSELSFGQIISKLEFLP